MPSATKIDLNIEIDVLTAGSAAEITNAVFQLLLYQRNQIPFVYKTYDYYITKWTQEQKTNGQNINSNDSVDATFEIPNFNVERQRQLATQTKKSIKAMQDLIYQIFEQHSVKSLRFLFGSTSFTPLEAYTIKFQTITISQKHSHQHHRVTPALLNQALIALLTNEDLYTTFSKNLCPTNVFLELELLDDTKYKDNGTKSEIFPKDFCELPAACKDVQLNLVHLKPMSLADNMLYCCKELQVFEDILRLSLSDAPEIENENVEKQVTTPSSAWWEAEIFVRGFKEKTVKCGSIWTK